MIVLVLLIIIGSYGLTCNLASCKNSNNGNIMIHTGDYIVDNSVQYPIKYIRRHKQKTNEVIYAPHVEKEASEWKRSCISENCCYKEYVHMGCEHYNGFPDIMNRADTLKAWVNPGYDNTHSHGLSFECPGHNKVCIDQLIYYKGMNITQDTVYKFQDYEVVSDNRSFLVYGGYNIIYGILWNDEILENYDEALPAIQVKYSSGTTEWIINNPKGERTQRYYMEGVPLYEGEEVCKIDKLATCLNYKITKFEHSECYDCSLTYLVDIKELPCKIDNEMIECDTYNTYKEKCHDIEYEGHKYCPREEIYFDDKEESSGWIEPYSRENHKIIEIHNLFGNNWKMLAILIGIIVVLFIVVMGLGSCLVGVIILRLIF